MFDSLLNNIIIKLWAGQKKVGPNKNVLLTKSCESFANTIYDLKWSLKYIHQNGKVSHSVTITERASKWNLRKVIHKVERTKLPKEIDALVRKHSHAKDFNHLQ